MLALPLFLSLQLLLTQDPQSTPPGHEPPRVVLTSDAEARAAWDALAKATLDEEPVTAFDLAFELRVRPDDIQTNDLSARYRFLSPGFVRATLESGREHLRGPAGDYLIDGDEVLKLTGREAAEDKKQIDEAVGVARNFLALTDPARLRPSSVQPATSPEHMLPGAMKERGRALRWISITTDGFHLLTSSSKLPEGARRVQHALLGLDPKAPVLQLAVVVEDTLDADGAPMVRPSQVLLDLRGSSALDGFQVPRHLSVHGLVGGDSTPRFRSKPSYELWLRGGTLRPKFLADAFLP